MSSAAQVCHIMALVVFSTACPFAVAQELGDPVRGQDYALEHCADCHAVLPEDEYSPNPDSPSFEAIANIPAMSRRALTVWFQSPHPTMPNFVISREDADDVIAYLYGLKESP